LQLVEAIGDRPEVGQAVLQSEGDGADDLSALDIMQYGDRSPISSICLSLNQTIRASLSTKVAPSIISSIIASRARAAANCSFLPGGMACVLPPYA
jgi:hypothetical protein